MTGAGGFIGSHLCEALRDAGHDVTGMARYCSRDTFGWLDEVEGVRKVRGDVLDAGHMERLIAGHDIVFHLAALGSVPYSFEAPEVVEMVNTGGSINVWKAAHRCNAKIVQTSTSEVYGTAQFVPMTEAHPLNPQSPYAASKVKADKWLQNIHRVHGWGAVIVRPFNTYGPRQSERAIVPSIIRQALDPKCEAIELGNLDSIRDLTYVKDTVAGIIAASQLEDIGPWHVGGGAVTTVADLAAAILDALDCDKLVIEKGERKRPSATEVKRLECDASKLTKATGWRPKFTLNEGLSRTVDWFRARPHQSIGYVT